MKNIAFPLPVSAAAFHLSPAHTHTSSSTACIFLSDTVCWLQMNIKDIYIWLACVGCSLKTRQKLNANTAADESETRIHFWEKDSEALRYNIFVESRFRPLALRARHDGVKDSKRHSKTWFLVFSYDPSRLCGRHWQTRTGGGGGTISLN